MTDKVVVLVSCSNADEASRLARELVRKRLAACVNISAPVRSIYRWQGKLEDDHEILLVIKTARPLFDRVRRTVERLHSYQVPEVVCLPIIDGAPNYLNWLSAAVSAPTAEERPKARLRRTKPGGR